MGDVIRVVVVDDDALVRAGVGMILGGADDVEVVAEGSDGSEAEALVKRFRPALVLMDIRMPRMDGLEATERLMATPDAPAVLIMTTFDADEHVLRALRAGAAGFVLKDTPPGELVEAVRRVAAGEATLSPSVTRRLIDLVSDPEHADGGARRREARARLARLTERELEVAVAVGEGKANADIGRELHMSTATVKAHVSRLLEKLEVDNRVGVALLAHDAGAGDD